MIDAGAVREWLAEGDVELETLTDEELAAVTPRVRDDQRLVPLGRLAGLSEAERRLALRTAMRSLLARGLAGVPRDARLLGDDLVEYDALGDLATVLGAVADSRFIAVAERRRGEDGDARVFYGLGDAAVLDEQPDGDGFHRYVLRSPERAALALADYLDPEGRADPGMDGGAAVVWTPEEAPPGWAGVEAALANAEVHARVVVRDRGEDPAVAPLDVVAATTSDGLWVLIGFQREDGGELLKAQRATRALVQGLALRCLRV